jgi:hypothetical protein
MESGLGRYCLVSDETATTEFQDRCLKPLGHPSLGDLPSGLSARERQDLSRRWRAVSLKPHRLSISARNA